MRAAARKWRRLAVNRLVSGAAALNWGCTLPRV